MATSQFKPFATRPDANVTPQSEWENLPALLSGFAGGKASSAQVNKALRQTSFIAAALAQFVSDKSGQDVLDDGDITAFLAKLTSGFGNQYLSRQNPFADIKADGAGAVSAALANLGLGTAAKRDVGNSTNQIPDMSFFTRTVWRVSIANRPHNSNGWRHNSQWWIYASVPVSVSRIMPGSCWYCLRQPGAKGIRYLKLIRQNSGKPEYRRH